MPWIAVLCLLVVGACRFDADYTGATVLCRDDMCPAGLECREDLTPPTCREPRMDAAVDMPIDTMGDGNDMMLPALTCMQPGILSSGVMASGSTASRTNTVTSQCNGGVMNAADAVYRISTTAINQQLMVSITGSLNAYVIQPCSVAPATPMCIGTTAASSVSPITVTATTIGQYFVVVDAIPPATSGAYGLTVTIQ